MIWCVTEIEFEKAMAEAGFQLAGESEFYRRYTRGPAVVVIRWRGGSITVQEVERAFNEADLDPPEMISHFGD